MKLHIFYFCSNPKVDIFQSPPFHDTPKPKLHLKLHKYGAP